MIVITIKIIITTIIISRILSLISVVIIITIIICTVNINIIIIIKCFYSLAILALCRVMTLPQYDNAAMWRWRFVTLSHCGRASALSALAHNAMYDWLAHV